MYDSACTITKKCRRLLVSSTGYPHAPISQRVTLPLPFLWVDSSGVYHYPRQTDHRCFPHHGKVHRTGFTAPPTPIKAFRIVRLMAFPLCCFLLSDVTGLYNASAVFLHRRILRRIFQRSIYRKAHISCFYLILSSALSDHCKNMLLHYTMPTITTVFIIFA